MMRIALTLFCMLCLFQVKAQKLSGQWTGGFVSANDPFSGKTDYVLEIEVKGDDVTGYSYTYFNIVGKRCYVICRLQGSYDKDSKSLVVTEVEKVKSNTPPDFRDMFQTHELTYFKSGESETLRGRWKPARTKDGNDNGSTELERKALVKVVPKNTTPPVVQNAIPSPKPGAKSTAPKPGTSAKPPVAKTTPNTQKTTAPKTSTQGTAKTTPPKTTSKPPVTKTGSPSITRANTPATIPDNKTAQKPVTIDNNLPNTEKPKAPSTISSPTNSKIEKRSKQLIRVIEVDSKTFKVDMYDNGQIDGDTISLYFNGKLMVSRQRLSTEPIHLNITMDPTREDNELVMYAENLGSIPPNTALMVVTVGDKRYEVNISSSEQTSGTVRFKLKE
jgi:hypothetical protein